MKAIIIGAGIGGLAAAALLAQKGYQVTVLEKNKSPGGRAMVWEKDGFSFDMGPSWYQVPAAFEHFFGNFNKKPSDFYELTKPDPQYKVFFSSRETHTFRVDLEKNMEIFEQLEPGSNSRIRSFLAFGKRQYEISMQHILYHNFNSFLDYLNPLKTPYLIQMNIYMTLDWFVSLFTKNLKIQKLLLYTSLFIGGSPRKIPALYALMSYVDLVLGTYYIPGGMGVFIQALVKLCVQNDVTIVYGAEAVKIAVKDGRATGVVTTQETYDADVILSNADYPYTELNLLEKKYQTYPKSFWEKTVPSPSAFVMYLGLNTQLKNLEHHNLSLAESWDEHFDNLFNDKKLPAHPSYYVSRPSKNDPSVAPPGCDNIFITVQIPSGLSLTEDNKDVYGDFVLEHLEGIIGQSIRSHIILKRILAAGDYATIYNAYDNAAIGMASTFQQSLFRPANKSAKVKNLYYAGQYTAPGAGMPMCLISAEKAVERICTDFPV